jgi:acyl-CoA thioesterase
MTAFDDETAIEPIGDDLWRTHIDRHWNIGENPNGGYALTSLLRALGQLTGQPDPLTVTAHFLRPGLADREATVEGRTIRRGRSTGTASASLVQDDKERIVALASFGELGGDTSLPGLDHAAPDDLPSPARCVPARVLEEGVDLAIASRLDVRLDPSVAVAGAATDARVDGWIRFADGAPPVALALPMFADAFPPSIYPKLGRIGWVPTIELTVQVRRTPAPGWIRARLECDDVIDGRMVETGTLWDETGRVVARSRQLALLLTH